MHVAAWTDPRPSAQCHLTSVPPTAVRVLAVLLEVGVVVVILGVIGYLLLVARPSGPGSSPRTLEQNRMKQIGIALHCYADVHGELPRAASCSPDGKPLLSWRVAILPYIEEAELYKRFRLDEPWDSDHNLNLLPLIPKIYRSAWETAADPLGLTPYQVPAGKGFLFDPAFRNRDGQLAGRRLDQIPDGTSNTLMLVVAKSRVPWTKPQDLDADDGQPFGPRLDMRAHGTTVLLADEHVRSAAPDLSEATWRAVLTADGGEKVAADWHGK